MKKTKRVFFRWVLFVWGLLVSVSAQAQLRAGAAKADLTPDVKARKVPLGGYAARKGASATGVLAPVFARAVVLQGSTTRVAIVSCDLCFLPAGLRNAVAARLRNTPAKDSSLFLAATHTHTAPDPLAMHPGNVFRNLNGWTPFDETLLDFTANRIADAVIEASQKLEPVIFESVQGNLQGRNRNRRGDPTVDPQMTVVRLLKTGGSERSSVVATLINFAAHPTLFDDTDRAISPDYPGVLTAETEKREGGVCLFLNGAEGDATVSGATGKTAEERVQFYGKMLASEAAALRLPIAHAPLPPPAAASFFFYREIEVTLPPRKPHGTFIVAAATFGATFAEARALVDALMPTKTILTLVKVGDVLLIGFPCEPTGDIGLEAKAAARAAGIKQPCVVALVNDWLGYCLTPEQYRAGKYEATMSFYGETIGTTMLDALREGLKAVAEPNSAAK